MNTTQYLAEDVLIEKALTALMKAIGPAETMRFINLPRQHHLESVKRHRQWQETLNQEDFFNQVFGTHKNNNSSTT